MFYEECTLEEVIAYRELEGVPFNFGTGLLHWDFIYGTEEAYYKMRIEAELVEREAISLKTRQTSRPTPPPTYHARKKIDQEKIKKLQRVGWWLTGKQEGYYKRYYYSDRRKHIKKMANKKVRRAKDIGNHANYRKVTDYWWLLFYEEGRGRYEMYKTKVQTL